MNDNEYLIEHDNKRKNDQSRIKSQSELRVETCLSVSKVTRRVTKCVQNDFGFGDGS